MPVNISVVICCYNSEKVIRNTLLLLKAQKTEGVAWEVILVDNNSSDNTAGIAAATWAEGPVPLKIVHEPRPGLSNARLKGVATAIYPVISFIDDDNLVPDNWISYHAEVFSKPEVGILGCNVEGRFEEEPPFWYEEQKYAFATGQLYTENFTEVTADGAVFGAGMTLRKEIFEKLRAANWSPLLSGRIGNKQSGGEDSELCKAARLMGYRIFYTNEIVLGHYILSSRLTWQRLVNMTHGFGAADAMVLPYDLVYQKSVYGRHLNYFFRKHWWVNYLGKKIMLFVRDPYHKNAGVGDPKEIVRARMESFCEAIVRDRKLFREGFRTAAGLLKVKQ